MKGLAKELGTEVAPTDAELFTAAPASSRKSLKANETS
jgi:hypothetical protein